MLYTQGPIGGQEGGRGVKVNSGTSDFAIAEDQSSIYSSGGGPTRKWEDEVPF